LHREIDDCWVSWGCRNLAPPVSGAALLTETESHALVSEPQNPAEEALGGSALQDGIALTACYSACVSTGDNYASRLRLAAINLANKGALYNLLSGDCTLW
jgi:hypothetical protein